MPIWKVKSIGVDFGSSTTCVMARVEREKESKLVCFGYQGRNVFDTLIGTKTTGQVVYFSDALFAKPQEIDSINGSIKEGSLSQRESVKAFFSHLFDELAKQKEYDFSTAERICFGHPAYYSDAEVTEYCELMEEALLSTLWATKRSKPEVIAYPEPYLAAKAFVDQSGEEIESDKNLLVLDMGGFTFDMAMLCVKSSRQGVARPVQCTKCESFKTTEELPMGKGLTRALQKHVYGRDEKRLDPNVEEAKCNLFASGNWESVRVTGKKKYDGGDFSFGYEDIRIRMKGIVNALFDILNSQLKIAKGQQAIEAVEYVLFTGGASRMAPLRNAVLDSVKAVYGSRPTELLMDRQKATPAVHAVSLNWVPLSSETAVALGACLMAKEGGESLPTGRARKSKWEKTCEELAKKNRELAHQNERLRTIVFKYENG